MVVMVGGGDGGDGGDGDDCLSWPIVLDWIISTSS